MCKIVKKFTKGNARKFTVFFAFFGYAYVIKYQEKPTILCERVQITTAGTISARVVIKLQGATLRPFCHSRIQLISTAEITQCVKHTYMFDSDKWKTNNKSSTIKLQGSTINTNRILHVSKSKVSSNSQACIL